MFLSFLPLFCPHDPLKSFPFLSVILFFPFFIICWLLWPLHFLPPAPTVSSTFCCYQISAYAYGQSTWSTSQRYVRASRQTSVSRWSVSSSCSADPVRCCAPETWAPSSATSSSQSWTTWRPSGPTIWAGLCWRPWRVSSSRTPWGRPPALRASACWSALTRTTMRRAAGCWEPGRRCPPVTVGAHRVARPCDPMRLFWLYYMKLEGKNSWDYNGRFRWKSEALLRPFLFCCLRDNH